MWLQWLQWSWREHRVHSSIWETEITATRICLHRSQLNKNETCMWIPMMRCRIGMHAARHHKWYHLIVNAILIVDARPCIRIIWQPTIKNVPLIRRLKTRKFSTKKKKHGSEGQYYFIPLMDKTTINLKKRQNPSSATGQINAASINNEGYVCLRKNV